jgi:hypothetical protein
MNCQTTGANLHYMPNDLAAEPSAQAILRSIATLVLPTKHLGSDAQLPSPFPERYRCMGGYNGGMQQD